MDRDYRIYDKNNDLYEIGSISRNSLIIESDIKMNEDIYLSFKTNGYLSLRRDIFNILGLELMDRGDGIIGINSNGEIVLKYSRWEVCFDDVDTGSYCIPYLIGAELKIRQNEFDQICKLFNTVPRRYTTKIH